jgi:hypothetical protein
LYALQICKQFFSLVVDYISENLPSHAFDLSFLFFSDGKPLFRTVESSIWPLLLCCLNLPPNARYKPENMILIGCISFNPPTVLTPYLRPLANELISLSKGFKVLYDNRKIWVQVSRAFFFPCCLLPRLI